MDSRSMSIVLLMVLSLNLNSPLKDRNFYLSFWSDNVAFDKIVLGFIKLIAFTKRFIYT